MIVIDEFANEKFLKELETLKNKKDSFQCIHLNLANKLFTQTYKDIKLAIINASKEIISAPDVHVYFCEDGDVFIIAKNMILKEARLTILNISDFLSTPATAELASIYESEIHSHKLFIIVEQKIESRQRIRIDAQKKYEQQQIEVKRNHILSSGISASGIHDIRKRRESRTAPEIMMIEDDAFSRRLVENVLQKQYSLTALANADNALSTYARIAPDILFLDINLPDVSGHELLEKIMEIDSSAYVVMLSGNADQENILQATRRGAKGFIAKPFTREKLLQYIDRCPTIKRN